MRLLHAESFTVIEFSPSNIGSYAILSHTWRDGEVSFQDMKDGIAEKKPGYQKIKWACEQALRDGLHYVWVDTCNIDKTSSAELVEAINSMFDWYQGAKLCYTYLDDVPEKVDFDIDDSMFRNARWFTRGWTLQELIAPRTVLFYGKGWSFIGTKESLSGLISDITGIPGSVLLTQDFRRLSIAQRMSWAAGRQTERPEDIAYCLLGIMNVSMTPRYGEGEKAFIRLQQQIIENSVDHSLFAWFGPPSSEITSCGVLATSPRAFADCGKIVAYPSSGTANFSMTNQGLHIQLSLCKKDDGSPEAFYRPCYAVLRCGYARTREELAIPLRPIGSNKYERIYGAYQPVQVSELKGYDRTDSTQIIVWKNAIPPPPKTMPFDMVFLPKLSSEVLNGRLISVYPRQVWHRDRNVIYVRRRNNWSWCCALLIGITGCKDGISIAFKKEELLVIVIGLDYDSLEEEPLAWCKLFKLEQNKVNLKNIWEDANHCNDKRHEIREAINDKLLSVDIRRQQLRYFWTDPLQQKPDSRDPGYGFNVHLKLEDIIKAKAKL
jgi:Heterokaryon incompatibility protein (HET)